MRIVSLLPAATEIVAALGAGDELVGISHECDHPPAVLDRPRVTATPIDPTLPSDAIDRDVRRLRSEGRPIVTVDAALLRRLRPDLVITQALCEVCAVADGEVHRLAAALEPAPEVLSLGATGLDGIYEDIRAVGRALRRNARAESLVDAMRSRLEAERAGEAPGVLCIEWLDPPYVAGHWVPELVAAAGGRDVAAAPGAPSVRRSWTELAALEPTVIVVMLCGFGVERAERELRALTDPTALALLERVPTWILDGNAYTSRPGPRVVGGMERIRAALAGREMDGMVRWAGSAPSDRDPVGAASPV